MNNCDEMQKVHKFFELNSIQQDQYVLHSDQTVELNHQFTSKLDLEYLPFQFRSSKYFDISTRDLKSLRGAPYEVNGTFSCGNHSNNLKSLEHFPKFIRQHCNVYGDEIPPWEYRYLLFSEIQGEIFITRSLIYLFFRKYQNKKSLIPQALKELRELQIRWEQSSS